MKKLSRVAGVSFALILLIGVGVGGYVLFVAGGEGSTELERWIGRQVRLAAAAHLNAELSFDDPDYQAPNTVIVRNVRLTAADPANPDQPATILHVEQATLRLGRVPQIGEPLHIEDITLDSPTIHMLAAGPGELALVGFSNLVKPTEPKLDEPKPDEQPVKLTDVFRIRRVAIRNGALYFDPRQPDGVGRVKLTNIDTTLNVEPDATGWYALDTTIKRLPLFDLTIAGRFNLNDAIIELTKLDLTMSVGDEADDSLPGDVQRLIDEHDVHGRLTVRADGVLKFNDFAASTLQGRFELTDGGFNVDGNHLQVDTLLMDASLANNTLTVAALECKAAAGAAVDGEALSQRLNRNIASGSFGGRIEINASGALPLDDFTKAQLEGRMHIRDGHLKFNGNQLQLDELTLEGDMADGLVNVKKLAVNLAAGGSVEAAYLSQQLQREVKENALSGRINIQASGVINPADLAASRLAGMLVLTDGDFTIDDYRLKLKRVAIDGHMTNRQVTFSRISAEMLDGSILGAGAIDLSDAFTTRLSLEGENLHIHKILRTSHANGNNDNPAKPAPPRGADSAAGTATDGDGATNRDATNRGASVNDANGDAPASSAPAQPAPAAEQELSFRGKAKFKLDATAPLTALLTKAAGDGTITVTEGRFFGVPGVGELEDSIAEATNVKSDDAKNPGANDKAFIAFALKGDRAHLTKVDLHTTTLAARGHGYLHFDGQLNLKLNAGPVEKAQSALGPLGDITGALTDQLMRYRVTGTLANPKITPEIAGHLLDLFKGKGGDE